MCGRQRNTLAPEQVYRAAGTRRWPNQGAYQPSYNCAPGAATPVVRVAADGQAEVYTMRWGLVPSFTRPGSKPDHWKMFNARCETAAEKPVFSRLVSSRRCLVLADGFYEWKAEKGGKQPYYIHLQAPPAPAGTEAKAEAGGGGSAAGEDAGAEPPLVMAGLWDVWNSPEGELHTYTIITCDSSPRLQWLHDRMPAILRTPEAQQEWLHGSKGLQRLLTPYTGPDLVWHPVTPAMGKLSVQGPECCKQLKKPAAADFFKPRKPSGSSTGGSAAAAAPAAVKEEDGRQAQQQQLQQEQQQAATVKTEPGASGTGAEQQAAAAAAGAQASEAVNADEKPSAPPSSPPPEAPSPSPAASPAGGQKRKAAAGSSGGGKGSGGSAKKGKKAGPPPGMKPISQFFTKG